MKKMLFVILLSFFVTLVFVAGFMLGEVKVTKARLKLDIMLALPTYEALIAGKNDRARHSLAVQLLGKSKMFRIISQQPLYLFTYESKLPTDKDFEITLNKLQSCRTDIERDASGF